MATLKNNKTIKPAKKNGHTFGHNNAPSQLEAFVDRCSPDDFDLCSAFGQRKVLKAFLRQSICQGNEHFLSAGL